MRTYTAKAGVFALDSVNCVNLPGKAVVHDPARRPLRHFRQCLDSTWD